MGQEEFHQVMRTYGMKSPLTGNDLSEPVEFNLMFSTSIGPAGLVKGSAYYILVLKLRSLNGIIVLQYIFGDKLPASRKYIASLFTIALHSISILLVASCGRRQRRESS